MTPTELAKSIWGAGEGYSRSAGARRIRAIARELYGVQNRPWHFTPTQVAATRKRL